MEERRSYARVKTDERVTCRVRQENATANLNNLAVTDISPAGLCFISGQEIPRGTTLKMQLSLPFSYQPDPELYHLAKVAHCDRASEAKKFKIGCYYFRAPKGDAHGR